MNKIKANLTELVVNFLLQVFKAGAMSVRNLAKGEKPFLYASGWHGPGYIMIKGLVSKLFFSSLVHLLAIKMAVKTKEIDFVAGNVTGGVIPGWLLSGFLSSLLGKDLPFVYVKGTRVDSDNVDDLVVGVNKLALYSCSSQIVANVLRARMKMDFVAGASPDGMILAHEISRQLSQVYGKHVPFVYVREIRKTGGHKEMITGLWDDDPAFAIGNRALAVGQVSDFENSTAHVYRELVQKGYLVSTCDIPLKKLAKIESKYEKVLSPGSKGLVTEELVNFARTTNASAFVLRKLGFDVVNAATILYYGNPYANSTLTENDICITSLFSLSDLISVAEEFEVFPASLIADYREYLKDPIKWNQERGFEQVKEGGTQ